MKTHICITLKKNGDNNQVLLGGKNLILSDHVVDGGHHLGEAPLLAQHPSDHLEKGG